jgi:hypothetical protein
MGTHQRFLRFEVIDQRIRKQEDCDFSCLVAGSEGYLQAKFYFDPEEWEDSAYIRIASFWVDSPYGLQEFSVKLDDNNCCSIPKEVLKSDRFYVSVTVAGENYKVTTNKIKITQEVI